MKPRRTISGYILLVGIMGLSIVGGVVAFQIFTAATKTQLTTEQTNLIKSLDGVIDPKVMDNLSKREKFTSDQLNSTSKPNVVPLSSSSVATSGGNIVVAPPSGATSAATTQ